MGPLRRPCNRSITHIVKKDALILRFDSHPQASPCVRTDQLRFDFALESQVHFGGRRNDDRLAIFAKLNETVEGHRPHKRSKWRMLLVRLEISRSRDPNTPIGSTNATQATLDMKREPIRNMIHKANAVEPSHWRFPIDMIRRLNKGSIDRRSRGPIHKDWFVLNCKCDSKTKRTCQRLLS